MPGVLREPASRVQIQTQVMRIGRRPDNDIVVSELGVSKQHAELRRSPAGRYSIIDLGSHRGTYVNGTRVSEAELKEGDIVAIGHATFRLAGGELVEYAADAGTGEVPVTTTVTVEVDEGELTAAAELLGTSSREETLRKLVANAAARAANVARKRAEIAE
jgi:pSer/pThr/pTyr-binding forkhead associated (FHA) protein